MSPNPVRKNTGERLTVAGLFAGIGGIEAGLQQSGHECHCLCEIEPGARRVLSARFPLTPVEPDITRLRSLGRVDLVTAGFPCQDLSQAGRTAGISGRNSGLVGHIFRLLDSARKYPRWLLLENVSFMLHLNGGVAMRYLVDQLEARDLTWAYRIVDSRAFGLPQRRQRVLLVASKTEDPRTILLAEDAVADDRPFSPDTLCGFYWTEGLRGLGWAVDAVPTLKGGSTIGIPSPPAIWSPRDQTFHTPEIRDAERLQGFDPDWTSPATEIGAIKASHRWKLVGNAVSVPVATWIGARFASPGVFRSDSQQPVLERGVSWPKAAWGRKGKVYPVRLSTWPVNVPAPHLADFLLYPMRPLSTRAASGFLSRAELSSLRFEAGFLRDLRKHISRSQSAVA